MTEPSAPPLNPRKVRAGLAIITAIVLGAGVMAVVVDDAFGRSLMGAVVLVGVVRTFLLARSLRHTSS